ncbi:Uncharacterised protein [Vibrio cholerae]|nr:Uncharacterised protein [Vibrio cholerae]CSI62515.1 Uncharacterised protein [Vibrio cholerae]CSI96900.1 Uncharacterised protein [Vibrio cholerae]
MSGNCATDTLPRLNCLADNSPAVTLAVVQLATADWPNHRGDE